MSLETLNTHSISVVFGYLHFKDSIKICYLNKKLYINFIIFCYKFSFVPLNFNKKEHLCYKNINHKIRSNFDMFTIFADNGTKINSINIFEQIQYVDCINNVNNLYKIIDFIPIKLKYINFGKHFDIPWDKKLLPDTVESISFHKKNKFNFNIHSNNLPKYLKKISFGYMFNKSIDNLPESIEVISFSNNSKFNQIIHKFPTSLKEISFGDWFNKPLEILPDNVNTIYFSKQSIFNSSIVFPNDLKSIHFGKEFDQDISCLFLCTNIQSIKLHTCSKFNQPFTVNINKSIKHISFGIKFNNIINLTQCENLYSLKFHNKSQYNQVTILPKNIEYLYLGKKFDYDLILPNTIKILKFPNNSKFSQRLIYDMNNFTGKLILGKLYRQKNKIL